MNLVCQLRLIVYCDPDYLYGACGYVCLFTLSLLLNTFLSVICTLCVVYVYFLHIWRFGNKPIQYSQIHCNEHNLCTLGTCFMNNLTHFNTCDAARQAIQRDPILFKFEGIHIINPQRLFILLTSLYSIYSSFPNQGQYLQLCTHECMCYMDLSIAITGSLNVTIRLALDCVYSINVDIEITVTLQMTAGIACSW